MYLITNNNNNNNNYYYSNNNNNNNNNMGNISRNYMRNINIETFETSMKKEIKFQRGFKIANANIYNNQRRNSRGIRN